MDIYNNLVSAFTKFAAKGAKIPPILANDEQAPTPIPLYSVGYNSAVYTNIHPNAAAIPNFPRRLVITISNSKSEKEKIQ